MFTAILWQPYRAENAFFDGNRIWLGQAWRRKHFRDVVYTFSDSGMYFYDREHFWRKMVCVFRQLSKHFIGQPLFIGTIIWLSFGYCNWWSLFRCLFSPSTTINIKRSSLVLFLDGAPLRATFYVDTLGRKLTNRITVISEEFFFGFFNAKYIGKIQ